MDDEQLRWNQRLMAVGSPHCRHLKPVRPRVTTARMCLLFGVISACSEQPKRAVWAVVVDIGPHASPKWKPDQVVVTARAPDGAMGSKSVLASILSCHVGDTIHGWQQGIALALDEKACER